MFPTSACALLLVALAYQTSVVSSGIANRKCSSDADCPSESVGKFGLKVTYKCGEFLKGFYNTTVNEQTRRTNYTGDPNRNYTVCECNTIGDLNATLLYFEDWHLNIDSSDRECAIAAGEPCLSSAVTTYVGRGCASLQCLTDRKPEICEGVSGEYVSKVSRNSCKTSFPPVSQLIFVVLILMVTLIQSLLLEINQ